MKTHVEFRSARFPPYEKEEDEINPGRWGKRLAEFLAERLARSGFPSGEIYAEDWGWAIPIENDGFSLWVGCGNYEEHADGFLVFIEPSKPVIRRLWRKISTEVRVTALAAAIESILSREPSVRDLRWWNEG
jgi:hypothetical protein